MLIIYVINNCHLRQQRIKITLGYLDVQHMNDLQLLSEIGAKIREFRMEKKLSQNDLAILCNFEKASMSRIEAGKTNVTIFTLYKISKALNVNIADLLSK